MPSGGAFGGITLVRVAGIPVRVHWTLLVVLPLFAWFIAARVPEERDAPWKRSLALSISTSTRRTAPSSVT